jgi:predicted nucleic acid-binding protein
VLATPVNGSPGVDLHRGATGGPSIADAHIETERHQRVPSASLAEEGGEGNLFHDVHTAALMREHGIKRIVTRDTDFQRFPFLEVVDPLA